MYRGSGQLTECGTDPEVRNFPGLPVTATSKTNPRSELNTAQPNTALPSYATRLAAIETARSCMRLGKTMTVSAEQTFHP